METLQDALFKTSGAPEVAVVDHDELQKQISQHRKSERIDRRTPASVQAELVRLSGNYEASEADRKDAEQHVNSVTGYIVKWEAKLREVKKNPLSSFISALINKFDKKIESARHDLNDPRVGAKANLERLTRIASSRKKLLEDFLEARIFPGAATNGEFLKQDKLVSELEAALKEEIDATAEQPSVGVPLIRAE